MAGPLAVLLALTAGVSVHSTGTRDEVTVTGCLTSLTATTGTGGKQSAISHVTHYVLINDNALPESSDAKAVVGAAGTADSRPPTSGAFWLDARDGQVHPFVGRGVRVLGTLKGNRSLAIAEAESRWDLPVMKVDSVRLVRLRCS